MYMYYLNENKIQILLSYTYFLISLVIKKILAKKYLFYVIIHICINKYFIFKMYT